MTATRRRYTKQQKANAVLIAANATVEAAAEATGIPRTTIDYWFDKPEFVELRQKTDAERAESFRLLALAAANRLASLIPTMDPKDLVVLMGVATDKAQLVSGGATARTESRSLTDGMDDHERARLKEVVKRALVKVDE